MGSKKLPGRFLNCDSRLSATDGYFLEALASRNSSLLLANTCQKAFAACSAAAAGAGAGAASAATSAGGGGGCGGGGCGGGGGSSDGGGRSGGGMLATGGCAATSAGGGGEGNDGGGGGVGGGDSLAVAAVPARMTIRGRPGRADGGLNALPCPPQAHAQFANSTCQQQGRKLTFPHSSCADFYTSKVAPTGKLRTQSIIEGCVGIESL